MIAEGHEAIAKISNEIWSDVHTCEQYVYGWLLYRRFSFP